MPISFLCRFSHADSFPNTMTTRATCHGCVLYKDSSVEKSSRMMKGEKKKVPKGSKGWMKRKKETMPKKGEREKYIYGLEESEKDVTYTSILVFKDN